MSQLTEIIENHETLDQLTAIFKHHGISTEFIAQAVLEQFEGLGDEEQEKEEKDRVEVLVGDLKQFLLRF
ncbi:hypothetical protein [Paenibacillus turpanensis]|uniref:hypothetical protein n=1 Tax=Paenibacillus turpanensis TaxID=2689078 RepID=UPI00140CC16D|nr:hypothetical protein [Paenibacillus turpanensis]